MTVCHASGLLGGGLCEIGEQFVLARTCLCAIRAEEQGLGTQQTARQMAICTANCIEMCDVEERLRNPGFLPSSLLPLSCSGAWLLLAYQSAAKVFTC